MVPPMARSPAKPALGFIFVTLVLDILGIGIVVPILPTLRIPPLPCWLAVHREIRGNPLVRRVYDFLAQALPPLLAAGP